MTRRILLVAHPRWVEAQHLADVAARLHAAGIQAVLLPDAAEAMSLGDSPNIVAADPTDPARGCELVCVLGGDGTFLRGAELSRGTDAPLLGVNLGHVGFLAEAEREDLGETVDRIVARSKLRDEIIALLGFLMAPAVPGAIEPVAAPGFSPRSLLSALTGVLSGDGNADPHNGDSHNGDSHNGEAVGSRGEAPRG